MGDIAVYTTNQLKIKYGRFFERSTNQSLISSRIPRNLWPLIPYATFWGVSDDWTRESLIQEAPKEIRQNLKAVVAQFDEYLDDWLAGPEARSSTPTPEYIAFSAMRMAADYI